MYTEILWYPGRQLNYMNLIKQLRNQGSNIPVPNDPPPAVAAASSPTSPSPLTANSSSTPSTSTTAASTGNPTGSSKEGGNSGGNVISSSSSEFLEDLVDPPKFITAKHISAIFEKLGYDANHGITVFNILSATAFRIKSAELQTQMKMGNLGGNTNNATLPSNMNNITNKTGDAAHNKNNEDEGGGAGGGKNLSMRITNDDIQLALEVQRNNGMGMGMNALLMKEKEKNENHNKIMKDLEELLSNDQEGNQVMNIQTTSSKSPEVPSSSGINKPPPVKVDAAQLLEKRPLRGVEEEEDEDDEDSPSGTPTNHKNQRDKGAAAAAAGGQIPAVMDVNDFIR